MAGSDFEQRVEFYPAYERRHDDPKRDYGICGARILFALIGPAGAVTFECSTGWYLPHTAERLRKETRHQPSRFGGWSKCAFEGSGSVVGFHHANEPDASLGERDDCGLLPGGKCWYDAGYLMADDVFARLVADGSDGLWAALREHYDESIAAPPPPPRQEGRDA